MKHGNSVGGYLAAYGLGMLSALLLPTRLVLVLAAVALVLAGLTLLHY